MLRMKQILRNEHGDISIILMAVVAAITIAISLIIVYSIMGGLDTTTVDNSIQKIYGESGTTYRNTTTPAANATNSLLSNLATFYTLSPIYIVVLAAVGIIAAIMLIMGRRK